MTGLRARFWIETALASLTLAFLVLTLASKDWVELVFGVDPDRHSGALEWAIVAACAIATVTTASLAGYEVRRALLLARGS